MRFHFIRDLFRTQKISVECVASAEQRTDILTKTPSRANFKYRRKRLMNLSEQSTLALGRLYQAANIPARHPRPVGLGLG